MLPSLLAMWYMLLLLSMTTHTISFSVSQWSHCSLHPCCDILHEVALYGDLSLSCSLTADTRCSFDTLNAFSPIIGFSLRTQTCPILTFAPLPCLAHMLSPCLASVVPAFLAPALQVLFYHSLCQLLRCCGLCRQDPLVWRVHQSQLDSFQL